MGYGSRLGQRMTPLVHRTLLGIYERHRQHVWTETSIAQAEAALERAGLRQRVPRPPAVCFVDLTGYTRLTEERGDEVAARSLGGSRWLAGMGLALAAAARWWWRAGAGSPGPPPWSTSHLPTTEGGRLRPRSRQEAPHGQGKRHPPPLGSRAGGAARPGGQRPPGDRAQGRPAHVRGDPAMAELCRASFESPPPTVKVQGGTVTVRYPRMAWLTGLRVLLGQPPSGQVSLNTSIPWHVRVRGGTAHTSFDLSGVALYASSSAAAPAMSR